VLVSIDAMDCQKDIAEAIASKNADYLLTVEGNRPDLHSVIKKRLEQAPKKHKPAI